MKHLSSVTSVLGVVGFAFWAGSVGGIASAQTQQGSATVQAVAGSADYSEGGGTWMPVRAGQVLRPGSIVRTAADSRVDLNLKANGPVVRLTQNTTLGLERLLYEHTGADTVIETQLDLKAGTIVGRVAKTSPASKYEVKTPNSVALVRGTEYIISADGRLTVKNGSVSVVYVDRTGRSQNFTVNAGQTFDPTTPTVRAATAPEIESVTPPRVISVGGPVTIVYEPGREPYVSPISPEGGSSTATVTQGTSTPPGPG
jgi:ferric-dicitrate binding protein FerR (iron transport regulator)